MSDSAEMSALLPHVVVIDGEPGAGKTTQVQLIADRLGYMNVTTGMLFCAGAAAVALTGANVTDQSEVAEAVLNSNIVYDLLQGLPPQVSVNGIDVSDVLFSQKNKSIASRLGAMPTISSFLTQRLQLLPTSGRWVFDRGTAQFPDADLKIWLDASPYARAVRRAGQLAAQGEYISLEKLLHQNTQREKIDALSRVIPPDMIRINTSLLDIEDVYTQIESHLLKAS